MDRLFAADENEVIFVAQWKSAAALSITVPDATLRPNSNGYSVSLDYSEGTLSGGKWLASYSTSSMEENVVADSLLPNTRVYAAIRFPTTVSVSSLRNQLTRGTLVVKNAQVEDVASYLEGTRTRTFLIVSVLPRSITVSFRNGGGTLVLRFLPVAAGRRQEGRHHEDDEGREYSSVLFHYQWVKYNHYWIAAPAEKVRHRPSPGRRSRPRGRR